MLKMFRSPNFFFYLILILAWTLFSLEGIMYLDPDFGWQLTSGRYYIANGIPNTDIFSYTMPEYPWINHEWLASIIIAKLFPYLNIPGLSILFGFLGALSIYIAVPKKLRSYSIGPIILAIAGLFYYSGIRIQIITWVFTAVTLRLVTNRLLWDKYRYFLPLLFLVWVNLHGGYAVGLSILYFSIIFDFLKQKKLNTGDCITIIFSTFITLINPYGINLWVEVFKTFFNPLLNIHIVEWQPLIFNFYFSAIVNIAFSTGLLIMFKKEFQLKQLFIYIILLLAALKSTRHLPLWILFNLSIITFAIYRLVEKADKIKLAGARLKKVGVIFLLVTVVVCASEITPFILKHQPLFTQIHYPKGAISYLQSNPFEGEVLSRYEWGGYLIWLYPEKKVFIDGRMAIWEKDNKNAFKDYIDLADSDKKIADIAEKYNIKTIVWTSPQDNQNKKSLFANIYWIEKIANFLNQKNNNKTFLDKLNQEGWKMVYQDKIATVYRKN